MKKILDVCCGSRMFWFDKENPDTIFADNREVETTLCDGRKLLIKPDIKMDFRNMPFEDNVFKVIGIIELVYIVLQSVVKPGITGFFKIDLHIKCYIYLS